MYEEELVEWDEVLQKAEELPQHLKRVLVLRAKGLPPQKIADRLSLSLTSVKQYNTQLNAAFNLEGLSRTEQAHFYTSVVRFVVQHSDKYPRMAEAVEYSDYTITSAYTGPTWILPKFVGTDPNDGRIIFRFIVYITLFLIVLIIIIFTLLAYLAGTFTLPPTPYIYLGI